ncbi:MAG TPA: carboxypeptidase regulatory-like domain-containing protein [Acidobacteriota bacterium]
MHGTPRVLVSLSGLMLLLCLIALPVRAQVTGAASIQGVITDNTGAVIPDAEVEARNLDSGVTLKTVTNSAGLYRVTGLVPGRYSIRVTAAGFDRTETPEVRLEVGQTARLDYGLTVGGVSQTIEVTASAALLNSETTEVGQVIDGKRIVEMPLNGRNYLQLAQMTAGVLPSANSRTSGEGGFLAFGQHTYQNNVLLDGADNSSRASGGPLGFEAQAVKPPVDAVSEFKVLTNNTSAEFGYSSGAKVLVTTKAGANQFHGSAYEFLRNDVFDATNFFANRAGAVKPSFKQNQYGGTIGGPIIKNKSFFFFSYQGTRLRIGRTSISTVPSRDIKERGDFSRQPDQRRNVFDPATVTGTGAAAARQQFPGNIISPNRWDPVAAALVKLYPDPNISGREHLTENYFFSPTAKDDANQYDSRVDYNFSEKHRFYGRYSYRKQDKVDPGPLPLPADGGLWTTTVLPGHNAAANLTSTFGTSKINEARFGITHFPTRFDIPYTENINSKFGIKNAPGDKFNDGLDHGYSRMSPNGYAEIGSRSFWPNFNLLDNVTGADSFSWQISRHTLKFGTEYRRVKVFREAHRFRRGNFVFNGVYTSQRPNDAASRANTGNGLADFLLGYVSAGTWGRPQGEEIVAPYYSAFVHDDWKITSNLTLNVGLRWEATLGAFFPNPDRQTVARYILPEFYGPAREGIEFPKSDHDCGCRPDYNNFAPRLGLAWKLAEDTVIRAGFGVYYAQPDGFDSQFSNYFTGPPRANELTFVVDRINPVARLSAGFPDLPVGTMIPNNSSIDVTSISRVTPYSQQWFLDVQRTLPSDIILTVGYAGSGTRHLATTRNINAPSTPDPVVPAANRRRLRANFNAITVRESSMGSNYNSMTAKAERRFTRGFTLLSSFTWSHNIDFAGELLNNGEQIAPWRDHYNPGLERSSSNQDRRLAFVTSYVWELPFGKGKAWMQSGPGAWVLGGWQTGGILSLLAGRPLDHTINVDLQNNAGRVRGNWAGKPNLPKGGRTIDRWFNTTFAVPTAPGQVGNAGRNLIVGPGVKNFDFLLARNFPLAWEGHQLQFRFESFNFTNTPSFGNPNTALGTVNAGKITAADDPRRIQFALKYVF